MVKTFFIKLTILCAILWSFFWFLDRAMTKKALEDKCRRSNWVFSFKDQHFDFVFCGDSRVYNMLDIPSIQNITRKRGLNIGYSGTTFEEQYLIIRKFIENGNRIDRLFLQADILSFNSAKRSRHQFRTYNYMAYLKTDSLVTSVLKDNVDLIQFSIWQYIPFSRYVEYNIEYPISILFKDYSSCKTEFDEYGSQLFQGVSPKFTLRADEYIPAPKNDSFNSGSISLDTTEMIAPKTMDYFKRIVEFCKRNQIEVILYTPPIHYSVTSSVQNRTDCFNFLEGIATENNIEYLSFLEDSICLNRENFFDAAHMNGVGAKKFSRVISAHIK